jgi:hypothetical protein
MSELEYEVILQAINQTCDAHKEGIRGILASIEASSFVTNTELKGIKTRLGKLNGTVADLQSESDARAVVVQDFRNHQKFGKWVHKNWWLVTLIFICSVTLIFVILERFGLIGVLEAVKEVKDVL